MSQKGFFKIAAIPFIVVIAGIAVYFFITNKSKEFKLVDAFSGQSISNTDVRIYSENGIRCVTAPCSTEGQEWLGKSDSQGIILVPSKVINVVTGITATGYKSGRDLSKDAERLSSNSWLIELDPDSKIDNSERRIKLIDSQTQKSLPNITFWVVNNQNCRPPQCQYFSFTGKTNSIGNAYYPISSIAKDIDISYVFVSGYKFAKFPAGWVNYKVALEKETPAVSIDPTPYTPTWKETVYNQLRKLSNWKAEENISDWQIVDLDRSHLSGFPKGKIFRMSKSFNEAGFPGPNVDQQIQQAADDQKALENVVKDVLADNGWKFTAGPTEGGFYHDYLYVKDNHPLILQIGTRDAVTGGMYISIQFLY